MVFPVSVKFDSAGARAFIPMSTDHLKIGFVRRGFSPSGGAEAYLKRLAYGVVEAGHEARLFTTARWPDAQWTAGKITRLSGESPLRFADELERLGAHSKSDVLMSLERVWSCDVYRAGDGVHRAWLDRRAKFRSRWRRVAHVLNPRHLAMLRLEQSLFGNRFASRVIANSHMVATEVTRIYGYPPNQIDVVQNGVPVESFHSTAEQSRLARANLNLAADETVVLFVGSGWERKGLRFAIQAIESCRISNIRLLVAGRGNPAHFKSGAVQFLGARADPGALYAAADIFLLPTIYDPFSNASLEALAAGIPVITTRSNGFAEIMREGVDGSIIETPDDVVAICRALRFWSPAAHREETRPLRLALASRYDISINVARTLEILLQAASAASTSSKIRNT